MGGGGGGGHVKRKFVLMGEGQFLSSNNPYNSEMKICENIIA
jgi:hypothetical protein